MEGDECVVCFGDKWYHSRDDFFKEAMADGVKLTSVYNMSGNKIVVRTLDLSQNFEGIKKDLDGIYERFVSGDFFVEDVPITIGLRRERI